MTETRELKIAFETTDQAKALKLANQLEEDLARIGAEVSREKDRTDSQDFGTTLVLVFGTPVAIALAKGLSNFLQRHSGASIRLKSGSNEIIGTNLDSRDAARIVEAFTERKQ